MTLRKMYQNVTSIKKMYQDIASVKKMYQDVTSVNGLDAKRHAVCADDARPLIMPAEREAGQRRLAGEGGCGRVREARAGGGGA